jgi:hypothetical protein
MPDSTKTGLVKDLTPDLASLPVFHLQRDLDVARDVYFLSFYS